MAVMHGRWRGLLKLVLILLMVTMMMIIQVTQRSQLINRLDNDLRSLQPAENNSVLDCVSWHPIPPDQLGYELPDLTGPRQVEDHGEGEHHGEDHDEDHGDNGNDGEEEPAYHRRESFIQIYNNNWWFSNESKSGTGSERRQTVRVEMVLAQVIEKLKEALGKEVINLLDSSCGDMNWMQHFLANRTDIEFTGFDIVPANIRKHKENFSNKGWKFEVHDVVIDKLERSYDLILSRYTMQHLKNRDISSILHNFISSGSKYLLTTNHPLNELNLDVDDDSQIRVRALNLFLAPYRLPLPICQHQDMYSYDILMLWDINTLT